MTETQGSLIVETRGGISLASVPFDCTNIWRQIRICYFLDHFHPFPSPVGVTMGRVPRAATGRALPRGDISAGLLFRPPDVVWCVGTRCGNSLESVVQLVLLRETRT